MKNISVILTRYNESNKLIIPCLKKLAKQKNIRVDIFFLDQKSDNQIKKLCNGLSNQDIKIFYKKIPIISLSYARNYGIKLAKTDKILFIDCDAIPDKNWAYELLKIFDINEKIAIVGGKSEPLWLKKPKWYHKSNIIREIYSLIDLSNEPIKTMKIVGVNFGINKKLLKEESYFNENLGRRPGSLLGGEESDLCKRSINKGFLIYYTPQAIVKHQIQIDRMSLKWILRRFYYGGVGKAIIGGLPKTYSKKRNIYDKLIFPLIVIPYFIGYLNGKIKKYRK